LLKTPSAQGPDRTLPGQPDSTVHRVRSPDTRHVSTTFEANHWKPTVTMLMLHSLGPDSPLCRDRTHQAEFDRATAHAIVDQTRLHAMTKLSPTWVWSYTKSSQELKNSSDQVRSYMTGLTPRVRSCAARHVSQRHQSPSSWTQLVGWSLHDLRVRSSLASSGKHRTLQSRVR
jgi:hypothetical protein